MRLAFHEGDFRVAQLDQMLQRHPRSPLLVQHDIGDPWQCAVAGHRNRGQRRSLLQAGVDGDEAFDTALHQQSRVVAQQQRIVAMDDGQEEVIMAAEVSFHAADNHGSVGIADFFDNDSDRVDTLLAQGAGKKNGPVAEFPHGRLDAEPGRLGDGARRRAIVQDGRNGAGGQAHPFRNLFQCDRSRRTAARLFPFSHSR